MSTILDAMRKPSYAGGNPTAAERTAWTYRNFRLRGTPASEALTRAREMAATDKWLYESPARDYGYGKPDSGGMRWIENPASAGLRWVGYADEIDRNIRHAGWYLDDEGLSGETARGVVFQMPARNGEPIYLGGYRTSYDTRAANLDFSVLFRGEDDKRHAADHANMRAESIAEIEREYHRAWSAGNAYVDAGDTIDRARKNALALIAAIKAKRATLCDAPAIVSALRSDLKRILRDRSDAYRARAKLADEWSGDTTFRDVLAGRA